MNEVRRLKVAHTDRDGLTGTGGGGGGGGGRAGGSISGCLFPRVRIREPEPPLFA